MNKLFRAGLVAFVLMAGRAYADAESSRVEGVEVFRGEDGALVFRMGFAAPPDPARVRILLDVDGPVTGEIETGADYMLEGQVLYRYPPRARGWKWNVVEPTVSFIEGNTLVCFFPALPVGGTVAWAVESLSDEWSVAHRFPESGMADCDTGALPPFTWTTPLQPEDIAALLGHVPVALSRTLPKEFESSEWQTLSNAEADAKCHANLRGEGDIPLVIRLLDVTAGREVMLQPEEMAVSSNRVRWSGTALDVEWGMVLEQESPRELTVSGWLKADRDRCLRLGVGLQADLDQAVWHEDFQFRRVLSRTSAAARVTSPAPYGLRGRQSELPFGVLTVGKISLLVETDPAEPRAFEIEADPARSFFGIYYDVALTAQTSNFPGLATFRSAFRAFPSGERDGFRKALVQFYQRYPAFFVRKAPVCGFARPLARAGFPRTVDFACDDQDLLQPISSGPAQPSRWMSFLFMEPWSYWMSAPTKAGKALRLLHLLTAGTGRDSELAAAALVGGARRPDGALDWQDVSLPWHTGLFVRVSADPRLAPNPAAPLNRAMAEWRLYRTAMRENPVHGIYIEPLPDDGSLDFNRLALGVSDYPATFTTNRFQPGLAAPLASCSDLAALAAAVRAAGGYVAGRPSPLQMPFAAPSFDLLVSEFKTWGGEACDSAPEGRANRLRALAGLKPVVIRRLDAQRPLTPDEAARHLEWCLFRGFLPGFFDRARGADRLWKDALAGESIRPVLELYLPLIRRLAAAGWRPYGNAEVAPETIWLEAFGSVRQPAGLLTLRNTTGERVRGALKLPGAKEPVVMLDPLSGASWLVPAGGSSPREVPVTLMPYEIAVRDWMAVSKLPGEADFLAGWTGRGRAGAAGLTNLASIQAELEWGAYGHISCPVPAVHGDRNEVQVEVVNAGTQPLELSGLKIVSSRAYRPLDGVSLTVATGQTDRLTAYFETGDLADDPWLEVQWVLSRGSERKSCIRVFKPRVAEALVFEPPGRRIEGAGDKAAIELRVRNYSNRSRTLDVRWEGDFKGGRKPVELAPDSVTTLPLPVEKRRSRSGEMFVEVKSEGRVVFQDWFDMVFR